MGRKISNETLKEVTVGAMAAEGKCVARVDGRVIFVEGAAPGDVADLQITRRKKKFFESRIERLITPSTLREEPFCEHYTYCGGCKWQHISYSTQLKYKRQQVVDNLERIAKVQLPVIAPIVPSEQTRYYRNKLEFTFSDSRWLTREEIESDRELQRNALGFHVPGRFDRVVDITHCYLQPEPSNTIRQLLKEFARQQKLTFYNISEHRGLLRNLIIRTANTSQTMVIVQFGEDDPENIRKVMEHLHTHFPDLASLLYIVNLKQNETFHDQEVHCFAGKEYIEEEMEDLCFRIGPKSFFQTNSQQALTLYRMTRQLAGLNGSELVYDLYTGTGTIANFVARQARKVVGIEYVPEAIDDARLNSEINKITNTAFFAGDMKEMLTGNFINEQGQPDVVITDPPRAGMHHEVVDTLMQAAPQRIVYVSCNPATQARDLALMDATYSVEEVQPVDMFPQTHHVENIVLLNKRS